jgi:GNAT superfamily N-acetyltransferase
MPVDTGAVRVREVDRSDDDFLLALSSRLSGVPGPAWQTLDSMEQFHSRFMAATLHSPVENSRTLIAVSQDAVRLGYIHMRPGKDAVTDEECGYVAILALTQEAEGQGMARLLMRFAEDWAREMGYRFLCLDVFADNRHAVDFYERGGFRSESIRMVKPL